MMILEKGAMDSLRAFLPEYLRRTGRWKGSRGKIPCINPEHKDHEPSMGYDEKSRRLHCFGCGKSYDIFDVVGLDDPSCGTFAEQVKKVCALSGMPVPTEFAGGRKVTPRSAGAPDLTAFVEASIRRFGCGGAYFKARGISDALCGKYRLFQRDGRAYLPVFQEGKCVSYCARSIDGREPRYRNSPGKMGIFGLEALDGEGDVAVAESIFDALSAMECGVAGIALCGVGNAGKFLRECAGRKNLKKRRFLLAGDRDPAGERLNAELEKGLRALGADCARLVLPGCAKDLNEALTGDRRGLEAALLQGGGIGGSQWGKALLGQIRGAQREIGGGAASTGFPGLDKLLGGGLFPGLYVVGAISSLGKTSLALQIADGIAESGRDVVYFTLEMSGRELAAKSVSRISLEMDGTVGKTKAVTMRQVLSGELTPVMERAMERYENGPGARLFFVESETGAGEIRRRVERHARVRNEAPVVIVDYLQILKPADGRATDKQNVDRAVVELKRLSRDFQIPVLAVSSFNRENYRNAVSMEAFKESGAVEYSSDVLLGMQLTGAGEPRFDVNLAKTRSPRYVELVVLKNRAGEPYGVVPLRYYAKYSSFVQGKGKDFK